MPESEEKPLVVIRSLVYNHEPYLRDCLEGFVMQQTTFPFVAVVHDDCSTDGSAAIIREYAEKYPHIVKPVFETENQYSKHDGSLRRAMDEACGKYGAKYIALCEGDDCWTDPRKLQKQVDFLEAHPEYTMVCSNAKVTTPEKVLEKEDFENMGWHQYTKECDIPTEDTISKGGWLIHTASIVYRYGLKDKYPDACKKTTAGDYTLQMFAALNGNIHFFPEQMVVYRFQTANSWTEREKRQSYEGRAYALMREIDMLLSLNEYSSGQYSSAFYYRITSSVWRLLREFPERAADIRASFGKHLHYGKTKDAFGQPSGLVASLAFLFKRACYYPYYPNTQFPALLLPFLRPFYSYSHHKSSIRIGRLPLITFVNRPASRDSIYVCGVKVR